jgi:hypothetical protein
MRDYQFVRDHCEGIDVVLRKGQPGEIYNLGTGIETTNIEMTRLVLKLLNKPESLIQPITDRPGHDRRYALDCSKMKVLGWRSAHNFEQAIEATVKWYVDNEGGGAKSKVASVTRNITGGSTPDARSTHNRYCASSIQTLATTTRQMRGFQTYWHQSGHKIRRFVWFPHLER